MTVPDVTAASTAAPTWRKSSFCGDAGCVEILMSSGQVDVRDSKNGQSPVLSFTPGEWDAFVAGVKAGEFDRS